MRDNNNWTAGCSLDNLGVEGVVRKHASQDSALGPYFSHRSNICQHLLIASPLGEATPLSALTTNVGYFHCI